jgi:hypothetical protein
VMPLLFQSDGTSSSGLVFLFDQRGQLIGRVSHRQPVADIALIGQPGQPHNLDRLGHALQRLAYLQGVTVRRAGRCRVG